MNEFKKILALLEANDVQAPKAVQDAFQNAFNKFGDNIYADMSKKGIRLNQFSEKDYVQMNEYREELAKYTHEKKVEGKMVDSKLKVAQKSLDAHLASFFLKFNNGVLSYKDGNALPHNINTLSPIEYPKGSGNRYSAYPTTDSSGVIRMPNDAQSLPRKENSGNSSSSTTTGNNGKVAHTYQPKQELPAVTSTVAPVEVKQAPAQSNSDGLLIPVNAVNYIMKGKKLKKKTSSQQIANIFNKVNK